MMMGVRETIRDPSGVTAWDSPPAFLIKSLLCPLAASASLGLALLICVEPFRPPYFLIAALGFLGTADLLETSVDHGRPAGSAMLTGFVHIALRWLLVAGFIWLLISVSGLQQHFAPRVLLTWAVITGPMLWLSRQLAQYALARSGTHSRALRSAVIIGCNELGRLLEKRLHADPALRIRVLGYFDDRGAMRSGAPSATALLGEPARLREFIIRHDVRLVYITWPMTRESRIIELLETLRDSTVSIYFVPDISIVDVVQGRVDLLNGVPLVGVCESPFYGIRGLVKRALDIALASGLILLFLPVLVAIAVGVRLSSPGPVIFRQRRCGLDGKEIVVYKFRSMTVTEDGCTSYTSVTRDDRRLTRIGAFIRRTSLDELPQLFNVLEGGMSLVGPRPHVRLANERYRRLLPGYMVRHKVKPGITGWAQINGARGGDDLASMQRRLELDTEYLRNWSLSLDLEILLRTFRLIWADRHAF